MSTIEELRKKINAKIAKAESNSSSIGGTIFPFNSLKAGDTVAIRFINDGEPNDVFWRERRTRTFEFPAVRQANGMIINNRCFVDVPAFNLKRDEVIYSDLPESYLYKSDEDVIQKRIKNFWGESDEEKALYYKFARRKSYVFQGFVRSGFENNKALEPNKLYRFYIGEDLFNAIKTFLNPTMGINCMPTDPDNGLDFILSVTSKKSGNKEFKDYSISQWARTNSALTASERETLEITKPFVLNNFIYERPSPEQEEVMIEMFEASYNSEPYDVVKWGKYFKPNNIFFDADGNIKDLKSTPNATPAQTREIPESTWNVHTPQHTYEQPVAQPAVQYEQPVSQLVAQPAVQTAPQIISQHTENVSGDNPKDVINSILGKYNIQTN